MPASDPRRRKQLKYIRATGGLSPWVRPGPDVERVRRKIRSLLAYGYSISQLAEFSGLTYGIIWQFSRVDGSRWVRRASFEAMDRFEVPPGAPRLGKIDPLPLTRMLQGLRRDGFPARYLAGALGVTEATLSRISRGDVPFVRAPLANAIEELYEELDGKVPADVGISTQKIIASVSAAIRRSFAPRRCWDESTIQDPEAVPEWTGKCGSTAGWWLHRRNFKDEACPPCKEAMRLYSERKRQCRKEAALQGDASPSS